MANPSDEAQRQLQKMQSLSQLTQGVAHDFNNSLQNIVVALEMLRRLIALGRAGEAEKFIAKALEAAQQAAALNRRFVNFSIQRPADPQPLSMNEVIDGMAPLLRSVLPNSIKLALDLAPDLWMVRCDAHQAENAILDLVLNARTAMPDAGTITVWTSNAEGSGGGGAPQVRIAATGEAGRATTLEIFLPRHSG